ncbi:MAG TPA: ParM/StbA family protein [Thermodesulfovibrionales bacterium]|nr:ParM/StbA family protein [Thermodesulfovibrionales bacterium]
MIKQNCKSGKGENMLVVDLGFSSAKFLCGDRKGSVKSCFRKTKDPDGYTFRGDNFQIGERALIETGSHYLRTVEELMEFYPLFVAVAAKKIGATKKDTLVVGLPFDFWKSETSKEKHSLPNAITTLKNSLGLIKLNDEEVMFDEVLVFPQGLGGIKDYLSENDGGGNILAIDIGFNTVISTLYSCEEKEILIGRTYYKRGLHEMAVNLLMPEIARHINGKTLTPIEINHLVQTGSLQVGFDLIDIKPEIDAAASTYIHDLLGMVTGDLKAHGGVVVFNTVLLFGGGARLLNGKLAAKKVKIAILSEPEFANARGFAIKAREINGE